MKIFFQILLLSILILYIGTGLYTQFPSSAYLIVIGAIAILFFDINYYKNLFKYTTKNMFTGFLLLIIFLSIQLAFNNVNKVNYFNQLVAVGLMILICSYTRKCIDCNKIFGWNVLNYFSSSIILGLLIIFLGQIAQITGSIEQVNYEGAQYDIIAADGRPGGFLNPNTTAAITMIFIFVLYRLSNGFRSMFYLSIGLPIAITIIFLTQSRISLIALLFFLAIMIFKKDFIRVKFIILILVIFLYLISIIYPEILIDLYENITQRFEGDDSSAERLDILKNALDAFLESPIFGMGSDYLVIKYNLSSHNQIVEIMASYGLFGLLIIGGVFILLYLPCTFIFFCLCILPMFIFSHNFFDSASYQASLGLAYAFNNKIFSDISIE